MKKLLFIFLFIPLIINAQDYYLHAGKLFDSKDGKILNNMTIIITGKKIKSVKKGFIADIVATKINPIDDITSLENVQFVMKEGKIYKN